MCNVTVSKAKNGFIASVDNQKSNTITYNGCISSFDYKEPTKFVFNDTKSLAEWFTEFYKEEK